jgi:hypothetical protein
VTVLFIAAVIISVALLASAGSSVEAVFIFVEKIHGFLRLASRASFRNKLSRFVMSNIGPSISGLLGLVRPSAIIGRIWSVVMDSVDAFAGLVGFQAPILEGFEIVPFIANEYAPAPIVFPSWVLSVAAPFSDVFPSTVVRPRVVGSFLFSVHGIGSKRVSFLGQ